LLPVGRPGGRVARDDNAMCWDGCLLLCSGGKKPAGRATRGERLERRMCAATMAGRTTPRMRKALPMVGRHTERAGVCLGWFHPASRVGACRNLRQGSGVHTHRQVVAGPVCWGIVMCAAINATPRQPAFLLQFAGPSLRWAVTAPSVSRRAQWPQPCSSRRVSRGCWQHSAVSHAPDDLPDGQRWRLQHVPDLIQMPLRHLARRRFCSLAAGRWRRGRQRAMLAVADGLHGCLLRGFKNSLANQQHAAKTPLLHRQMTGPRARPERAGRRSSPML